nr:MAG TPA: hypothetical protein [Bacteriophage sp.]
MTIKFSRHIVMLEQLLLVLNSMRLLLSIFV